MIKTILETIGNTASSPARGRTGAKEYRTRQARSRPGWPNTDEARKRALKPSDTIVEATSGNTGNALSMIAAVRGYKMLVLMPDGYTNERAISTGFGPELRFVGHFQVNEARAEAIRLGKQPGFYRLGPLRTMNGTWTRTANGWARRSSRSWMRRRSRSTRWCRVSAPAAR